MALKHCHHCFGISGNAVESAVCLTESGQMDDADTENIFIELGAVNGIGNFIRITEWISAEQTVVLFAGEPVISHTLNHREVGTLTVKHDGFAVFVSVSDSTADEVAGEEHFIRVDFSAEFVGIAAAVKFVCAGTVAAEVIIDLPDAVGEFVIVEFVLSVEEEVIDDQTGTG